METQPAPIARLIARIHQDKQTPRATRRRLLAALHDFSTHPVPRNERHSLQLYLVGAAVHSIRDADNPATDLTDTAALLKLLGAHA